jgi:hypothetical protein
VKWIKEYAKRCVSVASNSLYGVRDFQSIVGERLEHEIVYLPNYYPKGSVTRKKENGFLDIGCFGVIRPLKNQLIQALAAMEFAQSQNEHLLFHVNNRCEQGGESVLKNLRALLGSRLIEHVWETREQFLETLSQTDIGMQVSFSETFDITAADTVTAGIPLVTSHEVTWASPNSQASPTNVASIVARLEVVTGMLGRWVRFENTKRLRKFCEESRSIWLQYATEGHATLAL